uniref:Uncharacterized protein n=1 Tax=viral metagenome TaxID=1070528 RepID=A0A6H2A0J2_9ZZZZ
MRDPDRYRPLHRLTAEDLEEIYIKEILSRHGICVKEITHEEKRDQEETEKNSQADSPTGEDLAKNS